MIYFSFSFLIVIIINHAISLKQAHMFFAHFLEYFLLVLNGKVVEESK